MTQTNQPFLRLNQRHKRHLTRVYSPHMIQKVHSHGQSKKVRQQSLRQHQLLMNWDPLRPTTLRAGMAKQSANFVSKHPNLFNRLPNVPSKWHRPGRIFSLDTKPSSQDIKQNGRKNLIWFLHRKATANFV